VAYSVNSDVVINEENPQDAYTMRISPKSKMNGYLQNTTPIYESESTASNPRVRERHRSTAREYEQNQPNV
jgi:hypothetical protein